MKTILISLLVLSLLAGGVLAQQVSYPRVPFVVAVKILAYHNIGVDVSILNQRTLTSVTLQTNENGEVIYDWANTKDRYFDNGDTFLVRSGGQDQIVAVSGGVLPLIQFDQRTEIDKLYANCQSDLKICISQPSSTPYPIPTPQIIHDICPTPEPTICPIPNPSGFSQEALAGALGAILGSGVTILYSKKGRKGLKKLFKSK